MDSNLGVQFPASTQTPAVATCGHAGCQNNTVNYPGATASTLPASSQSGMGDTFGKPTTTDYQAMGWSPASGNYQAGSALE